MATGHFGMVTLALASLACHELAHLFVLAGYDVPVEAVELHPFGALIRYETPPAGLGAIDAVVAAAGPLQSFLLAALGTVVQPLEILAPERVAAFIQVNLLLACFNLIPVWPLDGGRILRTWLAPRIGDGHAVRLLARAGSWLGVLLVVSGSAASALYRAPLWVPVIIGAFLWRAARPDIRAGQQAIVRAITRRNRSLPQGLAPIALLAAREDAAASALLQRLRSDRYNVIYVLDAQGRCLGQLTEDELAEALLKCGLAASAGELLREQR